MQFLYKHWYYALAVVLCVVLFGMFKLYFASEPSEVKTVYTIAEPNPEQSQRLTAGLPTTTPVAPGVYHSTDEGVPQQTAVEHGGDDSDSPKAETAYDDATALTALTPDDAHKGMTPDEYRKHLDEVNRKRELSRRLIEYADKEIALADALIKATEDELSGMLSLFALMSPAQLQSVREAALKALPSEDVQEFFEDLANHSAPTKTRDEIMGDLREVVSFHEAYKIAHRQLGEELEQLKKELAEVN